jgi:thymidylate kinase
MIVSLSGIDGSGKTTRCQALVRSLRERGVPAISSKPSYEANEAVKDFCEWAYGDRFAYFSQLNSEFYISCLVADWLKYLARVLSRVRTADVLVCDRYIYDVLAQTIHMKAHAEVLRQLWHLFPRPDIDYLLEVSPETAYERLKTRAEMPMHAAETLSELRVLQGAYRRVAEQLEWNPVLVKDTTGTDDLAKEVEQTWQRIRMAQAT